MRGWAATEAAQSCVRVEAGLTGRAWHRGWPRFTTATTMPVAVDHIATRSDRTSAVSRKSFGKSTEPQKTPACTTVVSTAKPIARLCERRRTAKGEAPASASASVVAARGSGLPAATAPFGVCSASALCSANSADSCWRETSTTAAVPHGSARRKGTRQPHASICSSDVSVSTTPTTSCAMIRPTLAVASVRPAAVAACAGPALSTAKIIVATISPPTKRPWQSLSRSSSTSPATPAAAPQQPVVGSRPMPAVHVSMPATERMMLMRRPNLSAMNPKSAPPNGRTTKLTAKPNHTPNEWPKSP